MTPYYPNPKLLGMVVEPNSNAIRSCCGARPHILQSGGQGN